MIPSGGNIVILTGAGISKESGMSTFRDKDGIWATVNIEDVATPEAFARNPERVQSFYNTRRNRLITGEVDPNAAHHALAKLEQSWPGKVLIVTQNIDNLHERGGSKNVLHMHGELLKSRCGACGDVKECALDLGKGSICSNCQGHGRLRPHVVWFGEMPLYLKQIDAALSSCSLFLSIGTSGSVYPAAGFVTNVQRIGGVHTAELNLEPSEGASAFDTACYGPATEVVPAYVDRLLEGVGSA
jgi:NAD-dependent deacetylase